MNLTKGHPALGAARGLVGRRLGAEVLVDLAPVAAAERRRPLVRVLLLQSHEFEHFCAHALSPQGFGVAAAIGTGLALFPLCTIAASRYVCQTIRHL